MTVLDLPSTELIDTSGMETHKWLELRRSHICATDIAGILSLSPWASPWSVWADKMGLMPPVVVSDEMRYGKRAEAMITDWFQEETGLFVTGEQMFAIAKDDRLAAATVDGFVMESGNSTLPLGGAEWKTDIYGSQWVEIPLHYQCQAQWQMYTTGLEKTFFAVQIGTRLHILELERNQAEIDYLAKRAHEFHENYILTQTPPEVDGHQSTLDAISGVFQVVDETKEVELDQEIVDEYTVAKQQHVIAEERLNRAKAQVEVLMADAKVAKVGDQKVFTFGEQSRKTPDLKRYSQDFRIQSRILTNEYMSETKFRVLRPSSPKKGKTK